VAAAGCAQTPPLPALGMTTCSGLIQAPQRPASDQPSASIWLSGAAAARRLEAWQASRLGLDLLLDAGRHLRVASTRCVSFYSYVTQVI